MYGAEDVLTWPHFRERKSFAAIRLGNQSSLTVGAAFRALPTAGFRSARNRPAGLIDLHIAEAGHVLAVPLATSLLGAMGAKVTKLEDPRRMDVYRRRGPYLDGDPGASPDGTGPSVERSAYFGVMNHSKQSVRIDLENDREDLQEVLRSHDVVIENLGFRRAHKLGLDAVTVTNEYPHLLGVSSSGYGQDGPWSAYRAYAYNLHAACGLCSQTRTPSGAPAEIDLAWGDLVSAFALATVIAAWAVAGEAPDADECRAIDFSMAELLAARFNEKIAAMGAHLAGAGPEDGSNHQPPFAPNGVFATADGRWIAISAGTDAQWRALSGALGLNQAISGSADVGLRRSMQDLIESELATAVLSREAPQLASELQAAGVPAAVVASAHDLLEEEQLRVRGLFPEVEHPVWGHQRVVGLPWRIVGQGSVPIRPAPLLGSTPLEAVMLARGQIA
jgi:crotonobetainyl-CoA:carnitine CoA-transferase CaiB-like acyl-CoA transferase